MNQKGFNKIIIIVFVLLIGAAGYFVLVKKTEPAVVQKQPPTLPQITNTQSTSSITLRGSLAIYDPRASVSVLKGRGFKPLTWYLVPENVKFPGTPSTDAELKFDNNSKCIRPPSPNFSDSGYPEQECLSQSEFIKFAFGDTVLVTGKKQDTTVLVERMEVR